MVFPGVLLSVAAAFLVFAGNQVNTEYCNEEAKLDTDKAPVFRSGKYFIRYTAQHGIEADIPVGWKKMRHSKNTFSQKVLRNEDSGEETQSQGGNICNHTEGLLFECKNTYKERKCYGKQQNHGTV